MKERLAHLKASHLATHMLKGVIFGHEVPLQEISFLGPRGRSFVGL